MGEEGGVRRPGSLGWELELGLVVGVVGGKVGEVVMG